MVTPEESYPGLTAWVASCERRADMVDPGVRIRALIGGVVPAACSECLAKVTFLSELIVREAAEGLVKAGHLVEAEGLCEVCATHRPVLRVAAGEA